MSWVLSNMTFFCLYWAFTPVLHQAEANEEPNCPDFQSVALCLLSHFPAWAGDVFGPGSPRLPHPHSLPLHSCQWLIWKAHLTLVLASGLSSETLNLLGSHRWKLTEIASLFQKPHPFHTSVLLVKLMQLFHACHHFWNFYLRCCTLKYLTVATDRSNLKVLASFSFFFPWLLFSHQSCGSVVFLFLFSTLLSLCFPLHYPPVAIPQLY